jgi:hypothetical protein
VRTNAGLTYSTGASDVSKTIVVSSVSTSTTPPTSTRSFRFVGRQSIR